VLGPAARADREESVRLAEQALAGTAESQKQPVLSTLGAALYRVDRHDEAIRRLEASVAQSRGQGVPQDWGFLSMAHHRLGLRDEARRWLDRLRNRQPSTDPDQFWDELEIRLLRTEAEAVILYDPVFPADPFAR